MEKAGLTAKLVFVMSPGPRDGGGLVVACGGWCKEGLVAENHGGRPVGGAVPDLWDFFSFFIFSKKVCQEHRTEDICCALVFRLTAKGPFAG